MRQKLEMVISLYLFVSIFDDMSYEARTRTLILMLENGMIECNHVCQCHFSIGYRTRLQSEVSVLHRI